jgi:hypothetical protein
MNSFLVVVSVPKIFSRARKPAERTLLPFSIFVANTEDSGWLWSHNGNDLEVLTI